jgi:hypothetical protein
MRPQVTECCAVAQIAVRGSATQYASTEHRLSDLPQYQSVPVPAQQAQDSGARNCIRFQCAGDDGQLMAGCRYTLMFPDGRSEAGVTDERGYRMALC